jgi:hypothetical protein
MNRSASIFESLENRCLFSVLTLAGTKAADRAGIGTLPTNVPAKMAFIQNMVNALA